MKFILTYLLHFGLCYLLYGYGAPVEYPCNWWGAEFDCYRTVHTYL